MAPSPTMRRLLKETAELSPSSPNPTPAFHAAPVSDEDLHEWHFTLVGPPAPSPYAGGLYHGRITLPPQYPLKPPNFRFLTPSGRFEVNREICLSISGFHEETWMPAWGVRTALTALRTFMAEPGTAGQVGGLEAPEHVRKRLALESKGWRCGGCAESRTNEEIIREWWTVCRGKGVKVDEEGEDVGLEILPEGMAVEARDVGRGIRTDAQQQPQPQSQLQSQQTDIHNQSPDAASQHQGQLLSTAPSISHSSQPQSHPEPLSEQHQSNPPPRLPPTSQLQQSPQSPISPSLQPTAPQTSTQPQYYSSYFSPTPTPEQAQQHAEALLTPSDYPSTGSGHQQQQQYSPGQRPMLNLHAPPLAAASAALAEHAALQTVAERQRDLAGSSVGGAAAAAAAGAGEGGEHDRGQTPQSSFSTYSNPGVQQTQAQRQYQQQQQQHVPAAATITIDRAIAGVFFMLVVMVLKKIFYPGGIGVGFNTEGVLDGGGPAAAAAAGQGMGRGGFGLEREL